jgi:hypothetical protein
MMILMNNEGLIVERFFNLIERFNNLNLKENEISLLFSFLVTKYG